MSFVIAVCSNNFALTMSDGKMALYDEQMNLKEDVDEKTRKIYRINDNVCLGFAGDYLGAMMVVEHFNSLDCEKFTIETCATVVKEKARHINLFIPLLFIIVGKDKEGNFGLIPMSSTLGYDNKIVYPLAQKSFAIEYACPPNIRPEIESVVQKRLFDKIKDIYTLDDLEVRLSNLIKNIASKTPTVNKEIFKELIT